MASVTDQGMHGGVNGAVQGPVDAPVTESPTESVSENVRALAVAAKEAARGVAAASDAQRNEALEAIAQALENAKDAILGANAADVSEAQAAVQRGELARVLVDRLKLSPAKLDAMIAGVRAVAHLPDPIGRVLERTTLDTGLELEKVSCPLGLLAVIFEARPEAVTQIGSLAIKSANAVILKPGREVERTARVLVETIRTALRTSAQIPEAVVTNIQQRAEVDELLKLDDVVDLMIPRGSYALVRHVQSHTRIPVLGHSEGVCHIYVDAAANFDMALRIIDDAKTDYPAACNAVETVLVHQAIGASFLPALAARMRERGVRLRGSAAVVAELAKMDGVEIEKVDDQVDDGDWHHEYGDLVLAVKVVPGLAEAMEHIARYGSAHTDAIVTDDEAAARTFLAKVD
jgi:glutamate-5-semialdehyde dehydrogenase